MNVLICGSAPSAAFAIAACWEWGIVPDVWSDTAPRIDQVGAFFLHRLPPMLDGYGQLAAVRVKIHGIGSAETYTMKQWHRSIPSSFPSEEREEVWYESAVLAETFRHAKFSLVDKLDDAALMAAGDKYDFVFHTFPSQRSRETRKLVLFPVLSFRAEQPLGCGEILYNGNPADFWVRMTRAFGRVSLEFPRGAAEIAIARDPVYAAMTQERLRDISPDTAPVSSAEYLSPNVIPIGRFATWNRQMLSHEVYSHVNGILRKEARG